MHLFSRAGRAAAQTARRPLCSPPATRAVRALTAQTAARHPLAHRLCSGAPAPRALRAFSSQPMALNDLSPSPGSNKRGKRVGRGIGSGKGKTAGRGHKGTKARQGGSVRVGFTGGQTPLHKALPKVGFTNSHRETFDVVNVGDLQKWIAAGRLEPSDGVQLTMRDLNRSGLVNIKGGTNGIKLLGEGALTSKVHLEVSRASATAIAAVEKMGGTVTCAHYNRLALRALLKPHKFERLPRRARPPPRLMRYYVDDAKRGEYSPLVQLRNRRLGLRKSGEGHAVAAPASGGGE